MTNVKLLDNKEDVGLKNPMYFALFDRMDYRISGVYNIKYIFILCRNLN